MRDEDEKARDLIERMSGALYLAKPRMDAFWNHQAEALLREADEWLRQHPARPSTLRAPRRGS